MTESLVTMRKSVAALVALVLLAAGAGGAYLLTKPKPQEDSVTTPAVTGGPVTTPSAGQSPGAAAATAVAPLPDVVLLLTEEAVARAGIVVAPVTTAASTIHLRLPGIVEPNAYRQATVTPLAAGRVTRVSAELGARVGRGQTLAELYSPQVAEAQTRYVSAKAMLDAHDLELQRTRKLVDIGAASRQELERTHAEHASQTAAVDTARAQLELLAVPAAAIAKLGSGGKVDPTAAVPAPIDGVVTARAANVGVNVDQTTQLFTLVDLSNVWIVANAYEKDLARVRVGTEAVITTAAHPELAVRGRISYIDPQLNPETRTAKVRVEVPNPRGELRLGMYADVVVTGAAGGAATQIPRGAVQNVADRTVVYLVNAKEPGKFIEREVRLGAVSGELVQVLSGVQSGDIVAIEGTFFLRAEGERLGLRSPAAPAAGARRAETGVE